MVLLRAMTPEIFLAKVKKTSTCWHWIASRTQSGKGYGAAYLNGRQIPAHRLSWLLHNGPIPNGLLVCHRCDVRHCVRPDHLFLGSPRDNTHDMITKGREYQNYRFKPLRGEAQPRSKLTSAIVRRIRRDHASGKISLKALGRRHGVSDHAIRCVVRRLTWRHVE